MSNSRTVHTPPVGNYDPDLNWYHEALVSRKDQLQKSFTECAGPARANGIEAVALFDRNARPLVTDKASDHWPKQFYETLGAYIRPFLSAFRAATPGNPGINADEMAAKILGISKSIRLRLNAEVNVRNVAGTIKHLVAVVQVDAHGDLFLAFLTGPMEDFNEGIFSGETRKYAFALREQLGLDIEGERL